MTAAQESWMLAYLGDRPKALVPEVVEALRDEFKIDVSDVNVYCYLRRWGGIREVAKA